MIIQYEFCIATNRVGSEDKDIIDIEVDDDATEEDIEKQTNEIYTEWLFERNYGHCVRLTKTN